MTSTLDLNNIQGDILSGLPKKTQTYVFFQISNVDLFRKQLTHFVPIVKTVAQVLKDRQAIEDHKRKRGDKPELIPLVGVNIAFSRKGLDLIGIKDNVQDDAFTLGQLQDAQGLGDNGTTTGGTFKPNWEEPFLNPIHGLVFLSGDSHSTIDKELHKVEHVFGIGTHHASIHVVSRLRGDVRPGAQSAHEHFGFLDGISNPAVKDFDTTPFPGQETVRQGIILAGRDGDSRAATRPAWMTDGSFLTFRLLFQRVPEFNDFLNKNPIVLPGLTREKGSELLGARLVGRWKSGAPIDLAPLADDPALGADPQRNNNFRFQGEVDDQSRCPFAAHVRKTNPRADLEDHNAPIEKRRIIRRGVQFGPEVQKSESHEAKTNFGRGLLFTCYSSSITDGFQFIQKSWADNPNFPPFENTPAVPGIDPIIGQVGGGAVRPMSGTNPSQPATDLSIPEFVDPRGGEYFFSPSITALRDTFAESVTVQ